MNRSAESAIQRPYMFDEPAQIETRFQRLFMARSVPGTMSQAK